MQEQTNPKIQRVIAKSSITQVHLKIRLRLAIKAGTMVAMIPIVTNPAKIVAIISNTGTKYFFIKSHLLFIFILYYTFFIFNINQRSL